MSKNNRDKWNSQNMQNAENDPVLEDELKPENETVLDNEPEAEPDLEIEQDLNAEPEVETDAESEVEPEVESEVEPEAEPEAEAEAEVEPETDTEPETEAEAEVEAESESEAEPEVEAQAESEVEPETESEVEAEAESEVEPETESEVEAEAESEVEPEAEAEVEAEAESEVEPEAEAETESEAENEPEPEVEETPYFEAKPVYENASSESNPYAENPYAESNPYPGSDSDERATYATLIGALEGKFVSRPKPIQDNTNNKDKKAKKDASVIPNKTTLNLCIKERHIISPLLFVPILAVILAVAFVIGYFGVYKQFEKVQNAQAELDARKAYLQQILDHIADYDEVKGEYNRYNYEGYDRTIPDPLDVIDLIAENFFPVSSIRTLSISGRTVSMSITGLTLDQVSAMIATLEADDLVEKVYVSTTGYSSSDEDVVPTVNMTIALADASKGGN